VEAVGYGGRIWSHYVPTGLPGYIIQSLLILIAPALFAASIYIVLGRLIELIDGHSHSVIPPTWLTKLFVIGDCVSFFVQAMGGGIQAGGTLALLKMGEKIIVAGLFIQIFFFGFFVISAVIFNLRMNAVPTSLSQNAETPWRRHLYMLYITSGLILVRSAFRVVEYLMGNDGWILRHEFMLYIFDALLMLSVVVLFLLSHPGTLFADREDKGAESGIGFVTMSTRE
jgi:hypothetical protein